MGVFIWNHWARFVSISACIYAIWSAYWGIFYRKFFWDFVGGIVRTPGGIQPTAAALPFVAVIVRIPIIQIVTLVVSFALLAMEMPLPLFKGTAVHRSWMPRILGFLILATLTSLYYQGTNAAIWSILSVFGYVQAQIRGEQREEVKQNRGRAGGA